MRMMKWLARCFQSVPSFELVDLGLLPGGSYSIAWSINNAGVIVGEATNAQGKLRAFIWQTGRMTELPALGRVAVARWINDQGHIVGYSGADSRYPHSCLWVNGQPSDLGVAPNYSLAWALCINNQGTFVGYVGRPRPNAARRAFAYTNQYQLLPSDMKRAYAINNNGWIVGVVYNRAVAKEKAALYQPDGTLLELGTLAGADARSVAIGINANNQLVGWSGTPDGRARAFLWQNGQMVDLGTLPGYRESTAVSINDAGWIVGWAAKGERWLRPVLWYNGQVYDLQSLVRRGLSGWTLWRAHAVNNLGQIVGYGFYRGRTRAFLLNPLP
jgi:probable HAF family extracellular repeat protein